MNVILPVFIQNEETLELTRNTIHSLGDCNLIVVDNNSSLGGGYLRSVANLYIKNHTNDGYARAVNQGLKLCGGEFVAISNNDIRVSSNWQDIFEFQRSLYKNSDVDSLGSLHFRMTDYDVPFAYGKNTMTEGKERWCTGSFFVMRNKWLFDEHFLNSYDDWDIQHRIRKDGYQTCYTDMACYQHHHSFTQQQIPEREDNNQRNREYFKKKWGAFAENLFAEQYPEQMAVNYPDGFCL